MASAPPLPELDFESMGAEDVLRWAYAEFGDRLCLTCSWQKQSSVLVHMVSELGLDIPVIELDTHLFFRESYETRDRLIERYRLTLLPPPPLMTVAEQHRAEGPNLWETDPDRCCHVRKVEPLLKALEPYDAWISGIRRDQSPSTRRRTTSGPAASRSGSPGSPGPARPRSRTSSGPSSTGAGSSSSTWTATTCACTSRKGSASRRKTATRTSSASAGSPRA